MAEIPSETGLYWGKSDIRRERFNLIVEVTGEAPMLYIAAVYELACNMDGPRILMLKPYQICFGPKIAAPKEG